MNFHKYLCVFLFLGIPIFWGNGLALLTIPFAIAASAIYFIYFLYKSGAVSEILAGIFKSLIIVVLAFIPIIGIIILLCYVINNLRKSIQSLKQLLPEIIFSALLYASLFFAIFLKNSGSGWFYCAAAVYIILSISYSYTIRHMEPEIAFFKLSVLLLALPIAWMIIVSIAYTIANIVKISVGSVTRGVSVTQNVAAHMRGGRLIDAYTRNVTQTITTSTMNVTAGAGAITSEVIKEASKNIGDPDQGKKKE